jgi:glycosyltransferase involved in cell wall biosynthesis
MTHPVSVVMPAYNASEYIRQAIASVIAQTHQAWELMVVDDGSTDDTAALVEEIALRDARVRLLRQTSNSGVAAAANAGVENSRHELIARLDADDISEPRRLEAQVTLFSRNQHLVVGGTAARLIDSTGAPLGTFRPPADDNAIRRYFVRDNPFVHSSVMFRKAAFDSVGGYGPLRILEDYDLWLRLAKVGEVTNLEDILVHHRVHSSSVMRRLGHRRNRVERFRCQFRAARDAPGLYAIWPLVRSLGSILAPKVGGKAPSNM